MQKFLEARQSDDLRRDIASKLQLSDGPFFRGDEVFYWTEDKSKTNPTVHTEENGFKVCLSLRWQYGWRDLGTRIVKVNISKIRKDQIQLKMSMFLLIQPH